MSLVHIRSPDTSISVLQIFSYVAHPLAADNCPEYWALACPPHLHSLKGWQVIHLEKASLQHTQYVPCEENNSQGLRSQGMGSSLPECSEGGSAQGTGSALYFLSCRGPHGSPLDLPASGKTLWNIYVCTHTHTHTHTIGPHQSQIPYLWIHLFTKMYLSPQVRASGAFAHAWTHSEKRKICLPTNAFPAEAEQSENLPSCFSSYCKQMPLLWSI